MSFLTKIFGDPNERAVRAYVPLVEKINSFESEFQQLADADLPIKTQELKKRIAASVTGEFAREASVGAEEHTLESIEGEVSPEQADDGGETLDNILPEAFALAREASRRTLKQRHFDAQLIGGMVLHQGKIAEMRTGEGKTLTATLPVYLNALAGKGCHLVTVNDYLSRRDAAWMGQIYHALGLSTGVIVHDEAFVYDPTYHVEKEHDENNEELRIKNKEIGKEDPHDKERDTTGGFKVAQSFLRPVTRREAYAADITYGTNNEFGFDYLRDNMVYERSRMVQRGHAFAIVDEVDSILIDEARTPLIISAPDTESSELYRTYAQVVKGLLREDDYAVDEKFRSVTITDQGISKVEKIVGGGNLYEEGRIREVHALESALRAKELFIRDKEYVVKDGEIIIVDEFTGRLMPGRRYSEGLHQAIEAKEGVKVQEESRTLATITFQNYFRMYGKLSGMTGTAATNAEEFHKVYKLDVVTIPTNKPMIRKDEPDLVFRTEHGRFMALAREVKARHELGQPVLIGTVSIEKNEYVSEVLKREGVPHEILNAKQHEREGSIIAQAGRAGAVTVATNMAGRGVDIILGGNPPDATESQRVKDVGGLHIIGTERHEARRIDNQLRGRAGRQGDPGSTQFFLSLEDDLMRIFGGDRIKGFMERLGVPEDEPIQNRLITRSIEQAQGRIEGYNFDIRKHVLEYDEVMNKHREVVYRKRKEILEKSETADGPGTEPIVLDMVERQVSEIVQFHASSYEEERKDEIAKSFIEALSKILPLHREHAEKLADEARSGFNNAEALAEELNGYAKLTYEAKEGQLGEKVMRQAEKGVLLQTLDMLWMDHLEAMEHLRDAVRLRAYGQRDPLIEYKHEGHKQFQELLKAYEVMVAQTIFRVGAVSEKRGISLEAAREERRDIFGSSPMQKESSRRDVQGPAPKKAEAGRNDPCPCGAKKQDGRPIKYKNCHGKNM